MIHILGFGPIGRLVAHTLRVQELPVTILVRPLKIPTYSSDWVLSVHSKNAGQDMVETSSGFVFESSCSPSARSNAMAIKTLILCTKAFQSVDAIRGLMSRFDTRSEILLLNNGIGVKEEVEHLLSDFKPTMLKPVIREGILSHGAYSIDEQSLCHAGQGTFFINTGPNIPTNNDSFVPVYNGLRRLGATSLHDHVFKHKQLEKLLVNAVINPITAITGLNNGMVCQFPEAIDAVIQESIHILKQVYPGVNLVESQVRQVVDLVAARTATNISSMLQDVRGNRRTEIDYINGSLVRLAKLVSCQAPVNTTLVETVKLLNTEDAVPQERAIKLLKQLAKLYVV